MADFEYFGFLDRDYVGRTGFTGEERHLAEEIAVCQEARCGGRGRYLNAHRPPVTTNMDEPRRRHDQSRREQYGTMSSFASWPNSSVDSSAKISTADDDRQVVLGPNRQNGSSAFHLNRAESA